jgi:hypothetical protein
LEAAYGERAAPRGVAGIGFGAAALCAAVFVLAGCEEEGEMDPPPPASAPSEAKLLFVAADTKTTTETLTRLQRGGGGPFGGDIEITPSGGAGVARGTLMRMGAASRSITVQGAPVPSDPGKEPFMYTLGVGVTESCEAEVSVKRNNSPVTGSPKTVQLHYGAEVAGFSLWADGAADTADTTELTLTFDRPIVLAADEIHLDPLDPANAGITKGTRRVGRWKGLWYRRRGTFRRGCHSLSTHGPGRVSPYGEWIMEN